MGNFIFEPMNFVSSLKWMGIGMLGVFMIVAIIMTATYIIGASSNAASKKENEDQ